jgi:hypothetical protein
MLDSKAVVKEALEHMRTPFTMDQLMDNCFADGIPITNHQARAITEIADDVIRKGGFYTMAQLQDNRGTNFQFYNVVGEVVNTITLNLPNIAKDRKIPTRNWLVSLFSHIGYHNKRLEVKYMEQLIESHVRDGGSWSSSMSGDAVYFVFRMNERVKARYEFHREDLTQ